MTRDRTSSYQTIGQQLSDLAEHGQEMDRRFDQVDAAIAELRYSTAEQSGVSHHTDRAMERLASRVTIVEQHFGLREQVA